MSRASGVRGQEEAGPRVGTGPARTPAAEGLRELVSSLNAVLSFFQSECVLGGQGFSRELETGRVFPLDHFY